ncbi:putative PEP-binding protein [Frankia sp. CIT1]|uniref:putative PEP-binding protein n=1 Tax=Frankia sp. CIT1 TaxID=2880974 RepID=UPI001EF55BB1|nr:putative PEP-binding protein [Frankia sp. CIT1]
MSTASSSPFPGVPLIPYGHGHVRGLDAAELGTHGMEMDSLVRLGLPTVPGLTIPASRAGDLTDTAVARGAVELLSALASRRVGQSERPMLIRLVASAPVPAAGLPPMVAGLGLCLDTAPALCAAIGRAEVLYETWSATVRSIAEGALGVPADDIDGVVLDNPDPAKRLHALLEMCERLGSRPYPDDPAEQVALAATAKLARWRSPRGRRARAAQSLPADTPIALHLQALLIGPWARSGHGSATSRDPDSGAFAPSGVFHRGVRRNESPSGPGEPVTRLPGGADLLRAALATLEHHFNAVAHVGFELRDGELALLSAAPYDHPSPAAAVRLAVDLVAADTMDRATAVLSVAPQQVQALLHPQLRLRGGEPLLVRGLAASPGAASGRITLSSGDAVERAADGVPAILVMTETTPADVPGLLAADAVVTTGGGLASHAAVVARGAGRPAVCGASALRVDPVAGRVSADGRELREGDVISVDGRTGEVYAGAVQVRPAAPSAELDVLLGWADDHRRLGVRANADTAADAASAVRLGAEGIGLCRTEHQFLGARLPLVRRVIMAEDADDEREALVALADAQREDFRDLLRAVGDRPLTVRLLDAPMHEFLPHDGDGDDDDWQAARAAALREANPMLGVRGVRLAVVRPGLYPAQVGALFAAWIDVAAEGVRPALEVMIPLVSIPRELALAATDVAAVATDVARRTGVDIPYRIGTMVETPRAALLAGQLAAHAEFLSFGTNDLTQLTYGFSRDDVESRLLATYVERGLLPSSPFAELDGEGVGALLAIAIRRARAARPDITIGVCGEHGGDPASIALLEPLGLDYISCSPRRVPVARLAAAQARLNAAATQGEDAIASMIIPEGLS